MMKLLIKKLKKNENLFINSRVKIDSKRFQAFEIEHNKLKMIESYYYKLNNRKKLPFFSHCINLIYLHKTYNNGILDTLK
jgi:hypothetical protein